MTRLTIRRWALRLAGGLLLAGCSPLQVQLPHESAVPPTEKLPLDGLWADTDSPTAPIFRIDRGRMYFHSRLWSQEILGRVAEGIRQVAPRKYAAITAFFPRPGTLDPPAFGRGEIEILSESLLVIRTFPWPEKNLHRTLEHTYRRVALDDARWFLASIRHPGAPPRPAAPRPGS